jgi:hypothetical protein
MVSNHIAIITPPSKDIPFIFFTNSVVTPSIIERPDSSSLQYRPIMCAFINCLLQDPLSVERDSDGPILLGLGVACQVVVGGV